MNSIQHEKHFRFKWDIYFSYNWRILDSKIVPIQSQMYNNSGDLIEWLLLGIEIKNSLG